MTKVIITESQLKRTINELFSQKLVDNLIQRFQQESIADEKTMKFYIDRFQQIKNSPKVQNKDITTYSWNELKYVVDMNQPKIPGEDQIVVDDSNIIFEDQYVKIILSNSRKACVHYGNGYTFCVSARSDDNAFNDYRFNEHNYTTYFFEDKQKSKEQISPGKFKNPQHLLVVMIGEEYTDEYVTDTYSYGQPETKDYTATPIKITDANNDNENDYKTWYEVENSEFSQLSTYQRYFKYEKPNEVEEKVYNIEKESKQNIDTLERQYEDLFQKKDEPYKDKDGRTVYPTRIRKVPWITVITTLHQSNIKKIDDLLAHQGIYHYVYKLKSRPNGYPQSYRSFERVTKKQVEDKISKHFLDPEISEFEETYHPFTDRYREYLDKAKHVILDYLHEKNKLNINENIKQTTKKILNERYLLEAEMNEILYEAEEELLLDQQTIEQLKDIARTFGNGYVRWMANMMKIGSLKEEDVYKYMDFFKYFNAGKKLNHFSSNDIFQYKDSKQFEHEAINSNNKIVNTQGGGGKIEGSNMVSPQQIQTLEKNGIIFLGVTPDGYQVFKIPKELRNNQQAFEAQKNILGKCQGRESGEKISICTMGVFEHFNSYLEKDDLYVFFNMKDPVSPYQFHYQSDSFMDKNDFNILKGLWAGGMIGNIRSSILSLKKVRDNTIIKNFFRFLYEKNERDIPDKIKLLFFNEDLTTDKINNMNLETVTTYAPDMLTDEQWNKIMTTEKMRFIPHRTNKINKKVGSKKFKKVFSFGYYGNDVALAVKNTERMESGEVISNEARLLRFINENGENDGTNVNPLQLIRGLDIQTHNFNKSDLLIGYFMTKNIPEVTPYSTIKIIENISNKKHGVVLLLDNTFFLNLDGELSVEMIDKDKIFNNVYDGNKFHLIASYFNTIKKRKTFKGVQPFDQTNVTLGFDTNNKMVGVDINGNIVDLKKVNPEIYVDAHSSLPKNYFNSIQNKYSFYKVEHVGKNKWKALIKDPDGDLVIKNLETDKEIRYKSVFINNQGEVIPPNNNL